MIRRLATLAMLLFVPLGLLPTPSTAQYSGRLQGMPHRGAPGVSRPISEIMREQARLSALGRGNRDHESEITQPDRSGLPQNPSSSFEAPLPPLVREARTQEKGGSGPFLPQTIGTSFTAATLSGTNPTFSFPPDCMGAVGPTQYVVFVNGRLVTFNKATGVADGVLNADPDVFFSTVLNASTTSDPRIRYDRLTGRWFLVIINVSTPNRILLAVSNATGGGSITPSTVFTFFFIDIATMPPAIANTCLADYPTLGLDANALYIGTNNFCGSPSQTYNSSDGYVVRKSSIMGAGPIVVTVFRGLVASSASTGPYTPQGVDNYDPAATEGYFIGVDAQAYGLLQFVRISSPGGTPTASANIPITVAATSAPIRVNHLGNTGGTSGRLGGVDDRLFAAHIRNGRLWTAQNIGVNNTGVASGTLTRDGSRWYEFSVPVGSGTPTQVQAGTIFAANATNTTDQRSYFIPSVLVSGQGHAAIGFSVAGTNERANAAAGGRLAGDALNTMQAATLYTSSSTAYNPASDPGGTSGRRWGDYTYTSLDPLDDMTMWTVQQFCDATNSYGVRIAKLIPPPPATPNTLADITAGQSTVNVTLTGVQVSGSGFYDPGTNLPGVPAYSHLTAVISNGAAAGTPPTVTSATYVNPTTVNLVLNASAATANIAAEKYTLTMTNPDGQVAAAAVVHVVGGAPTVSVAAGPNTNEGNVGTTPFTFPVTMSATSASPVVVRFQTSDGTATLADNDYVGAIDSITIAPGNTTGNITVQVKGDTKYELRETFAVTLTSVTNATLGASVAAVDTILNDDPVPTMSVNSLSQNEGNSGNTPYSFTISLSNPSYLAVSVNAQSADSTATLADGDYASASGPVNIPAGSTSAPFVVNGLGDIKYEADEVFKLVLSSPTNATLGSAVGTGKLVNDDIPPMVSIDSVTHPEGNSGLTPYVFTVSLSAVAGVPVTVQAQSSDSTATLADGDYNSASGTVNIPTGSLSATFTVNVNGDTRYEADEAFKVTLSAPTNATLRTALGIGKVTNDDSPPTISVNDVALAEGNAGPTPFQFTVSLSAASGLPVTVDYFTADGTALVSDGDYVGATGSLTFSPGQVSKPITVTVNGDVSTEPDEVFTVNLTNIVGATGGVVTGTGTILNDDSIPTLTIASVSHNEGNAGTTGYDFPVSLSNPSASTVTVNYQTVDSTATTANSDYVAASGTLTLLPGITSGNIHVDVNGDVCGEPDEKFKVVLSGGSGATVVTPTAYGTILNDDDLVAPADSVIAPNSGENLVIGNVSNLKWVATDNVGVISVDLLLSRDNGATFPEVLATGIANSGTFPWTVTGPPTTGSQAVLKVVAHDGNCNLATDVSDAPFEISTPVVGTPSLGAVTMFALNSVRPNPTSGATRIEYQLPHAATIKVSVVDLQGREVAVLAEGSMPAGRHAATWTGDTAHGRAGTGVYFIRYTAEGRHMTRRVVLVK